VFWNNTGTLIPHSKHNKLARIETDTYKPKKERNQFPLVSRCLWQAERQIPQAIYHLLISYGFVQPNPDIAPLLVYCICDAKSKHWIIARISWALSENGTISGLHIVRFYLYIFYSRGVLEVRLCSTSVSTGPTAHPVYYSGKSSLGGIKTSRGRSEYWKKNVWYRCHFVHQEFRVYTAGNKPECPRWVASNWL
jgi:hypothetical protein